MSALNRGEKGYFGKSRVLEECRKAGLVEITRLPTSSLGWANFHSVG